MDLSVMNMLGLSSSVHFTHIACYRKVFAFALRTSPLSVEALQDISCLSYISYVKVKITLRLTVSQSVSLDVEPHLELMTRYLLLLGCYGLVFVWRSL
jgi:hypothetical protein